MSSPCLRTWFPDAEPNEFLRMDPTLQDDIWMEEPPLLLMLLMLHSLLLLLPPTILMNGSVNGTERGVSNARDPLVGNTISKQPSTVLQIP